MSRDRGRAITRAAVTGAGASSALDRFPTSADKRGRIAALMAQVKFFRDAGADETADTLRAEADVMRSALREQLARSAVTESPRSPEKRKVVRDFFRNEPTPAPRRVAYPDHGSLPPHPNAGAQGLGVGVDSTDGDW